MQKFNYISDISDITIAEEAIDVTKDAQLLIGLEGQISTEAMLLSYGGTSNTVGYEGLISNFINFIKKALKKLWEFIGKIFKFIKNLISKVISWFKKLFSKSSGSSGSSSAVKESTKKDLEERTKVIDEEIAKINEDLNENADTYKQEFVNRYQNTTQELKKQFRKFPLYFILKDNESDIKKKILDFKQVTSAIMTYKNSLSRFPDELIEYASGEFAELAGLTKEFQNGEYEKETEMSLYRLLEIYVNIIESHIEGNSTITESSFLATFMEKSMPNNSTSLVDYVTEIKDRITKISESPNIADNARYIRSVYEVLDKKYKSNNNNRVIKYGIVSSFRNNIIVKILEYDESILNGAMEESKKILELISSKSEQVSPLELIKSFGRVISSISSSYSIRFESHLILGTFLNEKDIDEYIDGLSPKLNKNSITTAADAFVEAVGDLSGMAVDASNSIRGFMSEFEAAVKSTEQKFDELKKKVSAIESAIDNNENTLNETINETKQIILDAINVISNTSRTRLNSLAKSTIITNNVVPDIAKDTPLYDVILKHNTGSVTALGELTLYLYEYIQLILISEPFSTLEVPKSIQ